MTERTTFTEIYRTTFLFSFVKVFQILLGIIRNKVVAILLGAEGVGIIGLFSNTINLLQTGAGLGISQSAVRDISEANSSNDRKSLSRIITLSKKVILSTGLIGAIITLGLAPWLSSWTFGNRDYTFAYGWLSIVVAMNILTEGQYAILKGMRHMKALARAGLIGSVVGLVTAVPMYYFWGKSGIVPSLLVVAGSALFFSNYYVRKIKTDLARINMKESVRTASPMIKMGVALMFVDFLTLLVDLVVAAYIRSHGGLDMVGLYRAGTTIIASYFGIVLNAMATDYYPRISAVHNDNAKLQEELNRQSDVGLTLIFPFAVLFVFLAPLFLRLLFSKEFIQVDAYTDYAMLATIIVISSNNMGMILLAKQAARIFTTYSFVHRVCFMPIYLILYNYMGLMGLGIAYLINIVVQFIAYGLINWIKYDIRLLGRSNKQLGLVLVTVFVTIFLRKIEWPVVKYLLGSIVFFASVVYSYKMMREHLKINPIDLIARRRGS